MNIIETKTQLIRAAREQLQEKILRQKNAMTEAQKEANSHQGAMASRYDTFKEEAQALRNGHAQQVQKLAEAAALLDQMQPTHRQTVEPGAIVSTNQAAYFVSTGLIDDPIIVDGQEYECISPAAPVMRQLRGMTKGAVVKTPGGMVTIADIL